MMHLDLNINKKINVFIGLGIKHFNYHISKRIDDQEVNCYISDPFST